jgi:PQQ-dependent catabolism-associated CXXCW motif protein
MRKILIRLLCVLALAGAAALAQELAVPEPDTYRTENYRAPTPTTLRGAQVVTTAQAEALWSTKAAVFVDVLPRPPRPANLPAGTLWHEKPRDDIPGSIWLPDTGYGALADVTARYFARGLSKATAGDRSRLLVFYCLANCWMSWNAAKRAREIGYSNIAWYRDGTDGWDAAKLPLSPATPEPRP